MTTFEKLKPIVLEQMRDRTMPVEIDSRLKEDLAFASLQMIGLVTAIESTFGINLEIEDFSESNFISVHSLVKMLEGKNAI
ncbi:MAG TPA: acyl carrier protein [Puia sp.]|jgi:acyl carrier protein|nr:acyl carrier protein [Puia sp.]